VQGNDISNFNGIGQGVIFENLLASPPPPTRFFQRTTNDWAKDLRKWKAHDLPLKALVDTSDRLGIDTEVYTFLDYDAVPAIDAWLGRKGVSLPVYFYENVEELAYDLRFKHSVRTIYVPDQEQAAVIGIRATVVDNKKAWTI
jgi:hypothetical protein